MSGPYPYPGAVAFTRTEALPKGWARYDRRDPPLRSLSQGPYRADAYAAEASGRALAELIDNGIDSFRAAARPGSPCVAPSARGVVPGGAEVRRGEGLVRFVDNGAGLDRESLENALQAGYSDKNRYDTLGLFGMGSISRPESSGGAPPSRPHGPRTTSPAESLSILPRVVRSRKFEAPVEKIREPATFEHGTIVEVGSWWTAGDPNAGFVVDLARSPKPSYGSSSDAATQPSCGGARRVRESASVNGEFVEPFEHCVWAADSFVDQRGGG